MTSGVNKTKSELLNVFVDSNRCTDPGGLK